MIAPEPASGSNQQSSLARLLRNTLLLAGLIFVALETWRPFFFLTDDNLDGAFPFYVEMGEQMLHGHSPFIGPHLFGGNYNFLHDSSYFVWHPIYLLSSLLAGTPFRNAIIDVDEFFMIMVAAAGFVALSHHMRRELALTISDGWITFYALSYTYTMIAMTMGACWMTFLGNYSALPWLVLGILHKRPWWGMGIVFLFSMHSFLGGHPQPTISDGVALSLFASAVALNQRSWRPLIQWAGGNVLALVLILPLLIPMLEGFSHSVRAGGVTSDDMGINNIPLLQFPVSIFLGAALWVLHPYTHYYVTYTLALGSSAAIWCLLPALAGRAKWRPMELALIGMVALCAFMIIRPVWVTQIMIHLPIFRSMRWPFRELVQFQFFLHLFLVVRQPGLNASARLTSAVFGTLLLVLPTVASGVPPTFNRMEWDRELVISGRYQLYWDKVRPLLQPGDRIAVIIPFSIYEDTRYEEPYSLLGTYNYAAIEDLVNTWGYSPTVPRNQTYTEAYALYPFGAYNSDQKQALMDQYPDLKFITLESMTPLKITLSSLHGPTVDLTPFVPARKWYDPDSRLESVRGPAKSPPEP